MNSLNSIRILSRRSDLAIIQAKQVGHALINKFPNISIEYITKKTEGDIDLTTPLSKMTASGVFTDDLRNDLIKNKCDLAVHSWKDLPLDLGKDTFIAGTLRREDQRDILFVNKEKISTIIESKKINVLSSSPRREYNLTSFIPVYFPFSCCNVKFHNIRGNVPIRFKKFLDGEGDALVVAKAAIDRLITNPFSEFQDLSKQIKSYISKCLWMILPLSHNPNAPGQGALGLEIRKNDKTLNKAILSITEPLDMKCVDWERQVLKKYNGGCHQKIGVSFFPTHHGIINSKKGETDENKPFYEWGFHRTNNIKHPRVKISEIFPNDLEKYKFFYREEISENVNKVNQIVNHCIWVSRKSAIPKKVKLSSTNVVWTSGIKTWKSLAKRGIWVNGTADGIGEDMSPNILSLARLPWIKLTHEAAPKTAIKNTLSTYRLKELPISFNLKNKKYFYWMSFSAFNLASKREPTILDANHACGPGNTYNEIKKMIKDPTKLDIYLSYEDWKRSIIDGP